MHFPRFIPQFRLSARLHWPWLAGLALLCFAAAVSIAELPTIQLQNRALERQAQLLEAQLRAPLAASVAKQAPDLRTQLATLDRLSVVAGDLQALVAKNGLALSDATYKPMDDAATADIGRMEIDAHLKGAYPPLKKTIAGLLATHDGLALESLTVRRTRSTDAVLEMELRFTFFYRKQT